MTARASAITRSVSRPAQRTSSPRRARGSGRAAGTLLALGALATLAMLAGASPALAQAYLDPATIGQPPVEAWTTYHGDYSGRHYSTPDPRRERQGSHAGLAVPRQ